MISLGWDVFLSYTHRSSQGATMAEALYRSLREQGYTVWLDTKMANRSMAAMKKGVEHSACVVAIITGVADEAHDLASTNGHGVTAKCCVWSSRIQRPSRSFLLCPPNR